MGDVVKVTGADGAPVEDAVLTVDGPDGPVLVDPGECDDIGPARCFHPGGLYRLIDPPVGEVVVTVEGQNEPPPLTPR